MRQHVRIFGLCATVVGLAVAGATTATAATPTSGSVTGVFPADYAIVSATFNLPTGAQTGGAVTCPVKNGVQTVPFSGGGYLATAALDANINSSFPMAHGWQIDANNTSGASSHFTVYAVCAKKPKGYVMQKSPAVDNPAGAQTAASSTCPNGTVLLGGGALSSSTSTSVNLNSSWPDNTSTWFTYMNNASGSDASVTVFRVCAKLNVSRTGYLVVSSGTFVNSSGAQNGIEAECESGGLSLGGGLTSTGLEGVNMNSSFPTAGGWSGDENNATATNVQFTAYVLCVA